ncbi:hypothetical protein LJC07_08670, partial [Christensenellaceae bacterium OttesenSCG-928-L17]|nr:hypothetical protein [Christensenellaceae bacterium OttesenSCG-928-L17]
MKRRSGENRRWITALVLLCLVFLFLCGCASAAAPDTVYYTNTAHSPYPEVLTEILPKHTIKQANTSVYAYLEKGAAAEAFDAQAVSALEHGIAVRWYPQHLATVVVAVDRDKTDARIEHWRDLPSAGETVGLLDEGNVLPMLMAAISYGLEGENFTLNQAAGLLENLQLQGHLVRNTTEAPLLICFDYQAAALKQAGRNMEIVVPREGTLTFQTGLLANTELTFAGDVEAALLSAGLRLLDGRCDSALYPNASAYTNAGEIQDYTHFGTASQDVFRVFRRRVLHARMYSSTDQREHQYFVMLYMVLVIVWTASFVQRAMQKAVRRAALFTGAILLGWIVVRMLKYQLLEANTLNRFFWYAFYLFQLSLPLVLLWLAWSIDKPDDQMEYPKWLKTLSSINATLIVLVFTNDLHKFVFVFDANNPNWTSEYTYALGYYIVLAACVLPLLAAMIMMLIKSGRHPRKRRFVFPLAFCVLLILYAYGYIMRIPIAWDSDFTMTTGLFTLLFVEACFRSGLIPVNAKYQALFTHSPLHMQIFDNEGHVALASQSAMQVDEALLSRAICASPLPVEKDADTLLFASPIRGGAALWEEDIGALNRLHSEIEESVRQLAAANAVLAEEEKIRRALDEEKANTQLMAQLEAEITRYTERLTNMIERLEQSENQ